MTFYGLTIVIGLTAFGAISYGFHMAIRLTKTALTKPMTEEINTRYLLYMSNVTKTSPDDISHLQTLIDMYTTMTGFKEWPFGWGTLQQLFITYLIPVIIAIVGFSVVL